MSSTDNTTIHPSLFNFEKTDYTTGSLFFGQPLGLMDTINKHFPALELLYKRLKGMDWDEMEFDFEPCRAEFKRMDPLLAQPMINQIGWQWETDTIAARTITPVMSGFLTDQTAFDLYQRIGDNECLIEGTEVLTPSGWKDLADVTVQDKIAQYDPSTQAVSFVNPSRVIEKDYNGKVLYFGSNTGHFFQGVTPNHRMPVVHRQDGTFESVLAQDLDYQKGTASRLKSAPIAGYLTGAESQLTTLERFLIAVQADGSASPRYDGSLSGHVPVRFSFSKERKSTRLLALCKELGFNVTEAARSPAHDNVAEKRNFVIQVPVEHRPFLKNYNWVDLSQKSATWCKDFLDEQVQWDGHFTKNTGILHTTSRQAVEISQAAAALAGYKTHLAFYPDNRKESFSGCWRLSWKEQTYVSGQVIHKFESDYEGKVRCLTVPTGFFLCRYKDRVSVTGNCIHSRTYSEIVKFSFDDPEKVMAEVLGVKEHRTRLHVIAKVFREAFVASHELALGIRKRDQKSFDIFFLFVVALFIMERGQFMISFPITFTYGSNDHFLPICKAVQKICQDEYEIHAVAGAHMINYLRDTGEGVMAMYNHRNTISQMVHEVRNIEVANLDFLLCGQKDLFGVTQKDYARWADFCFADIADALSVKTEFTTPTSNPLDFMEKWINISSIQAALQEEKNGQYLLGMVRRDDMGKTFNLSGLLT